MKYLTSLLLTLTIFAGTAFPQKVILPSEVKVKKDRMVQIVLEFDGEDVRWTSPGDTNDIDVFREFDSDAKKVKLRAVGYTPGKYHLNAIAVKGGKLSDFGKCVITVEGELPPVPPTPVPPGPGPVPPVPPGPTPGPVPIPAEGLRVLIVEEPKDRAKLPKEQLEILFDDNLRTWLDSVCVDDAIGRKGWNIWPASETGANVPKHWQEALKTMKAHKEFKTPFIAISTGKTGYLGPLPGTVSQVQELVKKFMSTSAVAPRGMYRKAG
jgi:hypothetical protein